MPRKHSTHASSDETSTATASATASAVAPAVAEAPSASAVEAPPVKKVRASRKSAASSEASVPAPVETPSAPAPAVVSPAASVTSTETAPATADAETADVSSRRSANSSSVNDELSTLESSVTAELEACKTESRAPSPKFLRALLKSLKQVHTHVNRLTKYRTRVSTGANNTGLLKPTRISAELLAFFNLPANSLHSRVEMTKMVWNYIVENKLQNAEKKKFIELGRSKKLCKLLNFNPEQNKEPVTYCHLQKFLKHHYLTEPPSA